MLYSYVYMVPRLLQEEVMMDAKGFTEKYKEIYKDENIFDINNPTSTFM